MCGSCEEVVVLFDNTYSWITPKLLRCVQLVLMLMLIPMQLQIFVAGAGAGADADADALR